MGSVKWQKKFFKFFMEKLDNISKKAYYLTGKYARQMLIVQSYFLGRTHQVIFIIGSHRIPRDICKSYLKNWRNHNLFHEKKKLHTSYFFQYHCTEPATVKNRWIVNCLRIFSIKWLTSLMVQEISYTSLMRSRAWQLS